MRFLITIIAIIAASSFVGCEPITCNDDEWDYYGELMVICRERCPEQLGDPNYFQMPSCMDSTTTVGVPTDAEPECRCCITRFVEGRLPEDSCWIVDMPED